MVEDLLGQMSELLAKAIDQRALDQFASRDELGLLRQLLPANAKYVPQGQSGYSQEPGGYARAGVPLPALGLRELLPNPSIGLPYFFEHIADMQPTMLQPVGGMDRIAAAFEQRLGDAIRFNAPVEQIRKTPKGVRIVYRGRGGAPEVIEADYCICALPLSILKTVDADLSPDFKQAINSVSYDSAYKIAWESRRFWEQDYSIYGGISFPKQMVSVIWYPSAGLFSQTGVVIAGYGVENRSEFGKLDLAGKLAASREAIEHLHPGRSGELKKPIYVSWGHIPYNLGSWASGIGRPNSLAIYNRLIEPDGPIYLAGDHVSHIVAWQEGAALSAHRAVMQLAQKVVVREASVA